MKITWLAIVALPIFLQPALTNTMWQQISESPFSIKANPSGASGGPRQLIYSPTGCFLAIANARDEETSSGSVSIFSVNKCTGTLTEIGLSPFSTDTGPVDGNTIGLAFSPSGTPSLATANQADGLKVFFFNNQTGNLSNLRSADDSTCDTSGATISLVYAPGGKYLASTEFFRDNTSIYQVDQVTGLPTCQQEDNTFLSQPRSIDYYPINSNPSYLAVVNNTESKEGFDLVVFMVDPITGAISDAKGFDLGENLLPHWVNFSPDGKFVAVAVINGIEIRKFITTGSDAPNLLPLDGSTSFFPTLTSGSRGQVRSVAYSPNGNWLATANSNQTISIFMVDKETGMLSNRQDLTVGHLGGSEESDFTFSVDFSPNNRFLAVSNRDDNSISVFTLNTQPIVNPLCQTLLNLSNEESCTEGCNSTN